MWAERAQGPALCVQAILEQLCDATRRMKYASVVHAAAGPAVEAQGPIAAACSQGSVYATLEQSNPAFAALIQVFCTCLCGHAILF